MDCPPGSFEAVSRGRGPWFQGVRPGLGPVDREPEQEPRGHEERGSCAHDEFLSKVMFSEIGPTDPVTEKESSEAPSEAVAVEGRDRRSRANPAALGAQPPAPSVAVEGRDRRSR